MRPVRSPEDPIGEITYHATREGNHIAEVRGTRNGDPLGTRHLRPEVLVLPQQPQEERELRTVYGSRDVGTAHVIQDDDRIERR